MRTTLFVAGFGARTRARDLAYEFERYGRLVRCDIPAPKSFTAKVYAFVEFEDPHDAEDAFNEMHGRRIDGYTISVQWARNAPSASWRLGGPTTPPNPPPPPPHHHLSRMPYNRSYERRRSMSPPRGRSPPPPLYQQKHSHSRSRSPIPTSTSSTFHHTLKHHSPPTYDNIKKRSLSPSRHYHSPPLL
ncbi:hypothetical protein BDF21DRAFT_414143 [Thamnidium elegans]|uniref:RRM domain-containing protein n=1 Tax=Thamnidium elegans TaxID=101142 RepID=A0A8H7SK19_9FUNG|nr:hypothetical protein INT48_008301 [Thamnidium elegans]KAI8087322.1 hypothetical protein BDF21DRAFT_414143 [Thamnidium elegans]